jgi:hypothetical protein
VEWHKLAPGTDSVINITWHPNTFHPGGALSSIEQGTYVGNSHTPRTIMTVRLHARLVRLQSLPCHLTFHENSTTCHLSLKTLDCQCSMLPLHHSYYNNLYVHIISVHNSVTLIIGQLISIVVYSAFGSAHSGVFSTTFRSSHATSFVIILQ